MNEKLIFGTFDDAIDYAKNSSTPCTVFVDDGVCEQNLKSVRYVKKYFILKTKGRPRRRMMKWQSIA